LWHTSARREDVETPRHQAHQEEIADIERKKEWKDVQLCMINTKSSAFLGALGVLVFHSLPRSG
jgi:hypothetical protein